jgi:hypothetical protein
MSGQFGKSYRVDHQGGQPSGRDSRACGAPSPEGRDGVALVDHWRAIGWWLAGRWSTFWSFGRWSRSTKQGLSRSRPGAP